MRPVVLQLIDSFHQGGSERQAIQLTRLLSESGNFEVRLATLSPGGSLRAEAEALNLGEVPSFPLQSFYDSNALRQLRRLTNLLRRWRIDILHAHDFYTNVFGMAAGSFARTPVRIASMRETAGMRTAAQKSAQQFAYAMAHRVVANSEAVRKKLIEQGIKDAKVDVIYNGIDLSRLEQRVSRAEALRKLGLSEPSNLKFVTIVANMRHDVKDYPMFLRAAQRIVKACPQTGFLLAGEGELTDYLKQLAKELGLAQHAYFLGRCDNITELLQVSEVCALSSKAEGFSNSILEYMAAARPVVATDVGGASEVIVEGETGYLVPAGDDSMMADRIVSLLQDSTTARELGIKGRRVAEEKFSCAAQLARTKRMYETLLAHRKN